MTLRAAAIVYSSVLLDCVGLILRQRSTYSRRVGNFGMMKRELFARVARFWQLASVLRPLAHVLRD